MRACVCVCVRVCACAWCGPAAWKCLVSHVALESNPNAGLPYSVVRTCVHECVQGRLSEEKRKKGGEATRNGDSSIERASAGGRRNRTSGEEDRRDICVTEK